MFPEPTNPVTPRTLRTRCQVSSVITIFTSTYPGKTLRSTVLLPLSVISVTVSMGMFTARIRSPMLRFSTAFSMVAFTVFS